MGFEQLAALKRELELAAKAQAGAQQQQRRGQHKAPARGPKGAPKGARRDTPPADPVVLAIARLQRQFPNAFPRKPAAKIPLKLGIHNDLYAQSEALKLSQDELKEAVKTWCQGSRYWACLTEGATRVDLAGAPAGTVTAPEAQRARQLAWRQRNEARKAAAAARKPADAAEASQPAAAPAAEAAPENSAPAVVEAVAAVAVPAQDQTPVQDQAAAQPDTAADTAAPQDQAQ